MQSNIRVFVSQPLDFGRRRSMTVLRESVDLHAPVNKYQGYTLVPRDPGVCEWVPIEEGARIQPQNTFLELDDRTMDEFLKAMAVELVRLGYVTGDPHGTKLKAVEAHLVSIQTESSRHFALLSKIIDKFTR